MTDHFLTRRNALRTVGGAAAAIVLPSGQRAFAQHGEVRIGMVLPFTGATAAYGPDMQKAAELTAKLVNDAGGILGGQKLRLIAEDSENSPTSTVTATKKLLEVDGVSAVIGFWGSHEAMAAKQIMLNANKVMMVSCSANAITEGDTKNLIWRYQAKATQWGPAAAKTFLDQKLKKVSVLALQNAFSFPMIEPFKKTFEAGGGTIGEIVLYNPDQPSYRTEVERVFGPRPEGVFVPALLTDFASIAKEVYRSGFDAKVLTISVAGDAEGKFLQNVGPKVAEGIQHFQPSPPLGTPSYARFAKLMGASETTLFLFAGNTHDQICTLALAMEQAQSADPAVFKAAIPTVCNGPGDAESDVVEGLQKIRSGQGINFTGAGSDCDFDTHGDQINRRFVRYEYVNGRNEMKGII